MSRIGVADDDPPGAVRFVGDLRSVDGDLLVGEVVGVQERVPQAQVPEHALRRRAVDDECLMWLQLKGTHRIGGVARRPPVGLGGHRVRLGDLVGRVDADRQHGELLVQPGAGGSQSAGQVFRAVAAPRRRIDRLDLPDRAPVGLPRRHVVAGEREHRVGFELEPRPRLRVRAHREREIACVVEAQLAVVHRRDDPVAVAAVVGAAVDGHRQIHRVAAVAGDPVGAGGVDGHALVERVGVVTAPLEVRADDVGQDRVGLVAPDVGVDGHAQQREAQPVAVEQIGFGQRRVRGAQSSARNP